MSFCVLHIKSMDVKEGRRDLSKTRTKKRGRGGPVSSFSAGRKGNEKIVEDQVKNATPRTHKVLFCIAFWLNLCLTIVSHVC